MIIKWLGHSCFKIQVESQSVVIDPYADGSVAGYPDLRTESNIVLCSHLHKDHCAVENVKLLQSKYDSPFSIETINSFHDNKLGKIRGDNLIHIITVQDYYKVVHLGDLGHMLNEEQIQKIKNCHILMVPVGGYYTIDAKQAYQLVEAVNPKVIIPMHYRDGQYGYDNLDTVDQFTKYFDKVLYLTTDTIEYSDELDGEVVIFDFENSRR